MNDKRTTGPHTGRRFVFGALVVLTTLSSAIAASAQSLPVPTTLDDFFQPGTQPNTIVEPVIAGTACNLCHAFFPAQNSPPTGGRPRSWRKRHEIRCSMRR